MISLFKFAKLPLNFRINGGVIKTLAYKDFQFNIGAEINYKSNLQIRLGRNNNGFLSTGIGLAWTNFSIDYAYRPVDKIYELYNDVSANPNVAHSQDGAKCIAMMLSKQIKVSTSRNLAKYIGAQGFHATQQFYDSMGFADMPVYEDGPITEFNVDKEKIRNELKKEYYE